MIGLEFKQRKNSNFYTIHNFMTMSLIHDIQMPYVYPFINIIYITNYNLSMNHTIEFVLSLPSSMDKLGKESRLLILLMEELRFFS